MNASLCFVAHEPDRSVLVSNSRTTYVCIQAASFVLSIILVPP